MKIIDLLNKIANGEEVPKKIYIEKFNQEFTFNGITYICDDKNSPNIYWYLYSEALKYKVEIIEEPQEHKIPEKLDIVLLDQSDNWTRKYNKNLKDFENTHIELNPYVIDVIRQNTLEFQSKINEILDYLEEIK